MELYKALFFLLFFVVAGLLLTMVCLVDYSVMGYLHSKF